jgi:hypothetical protein
MLDEAYDVVKEAIGLMKEPDLLAYNKICYFCLTLVSPLKAICSYGLFRQLNAVRFLFIVSGERTVGALSHLHDPS